MTIIKGKKEIKLVINSKTVRVNNVQNQLLLAPKLINGTTMVPIRFISENLDSDVYWDPVTNTIVIRYELDREFATIKYLEEDWEDYYEGGIVIENGVKIPDGKGELVLKNGEKLAGLFKGGNIIEGILSYPNGDVYEGGYKYNLPFGFGILFYNEGGTYEGGFRNGMLNGFGKVTSANGDFYVGTFLNDEYISGDYIDD